MLNRFARLITAVLLGTAAALSYAQMPVQGSFVTNGAEAGWIGSGSAFLTSGSLDKPGEGWLRLTDATSASQSTALNANTFSAKEGLRLSLQYAIWGGGEVGGDGMSIFLFDAAADMRGAVGGGGLGYCKGAGGWLGIGLDAYGNFASSTTECEGGPGFAPQAIVIRGPVGVKNAFVGGATAIGQISNNLAKQRPDAKELQLELVPKAQGVGFLINLSVKDTKTGQVTPFLAGLDFPYAAPPALRLGVAASTGGAKNIHEVRQLTLSSLIKRGLFVEQSFEPASIQSRGTSTLTFRLKPDDGKSSALVNTASLNLEPGLLIAKPVILGGSCPGTMVVNAAGNALELSKGFVVRPMGCTISVRVTAAKAGTFVNVVPPGQLQLESGPNAIASSATLTVRP